MHWCVESVESNNKLELINTSSFRLHYHCQDQRGFLDFTLQRSNLYKTLSKIKSTTTKSNNKRRKIKERDK